MKDSENPEANDQIRSGFDAWSFGRSPGWSVPHVCTMTSLPSRWVDISSTATYWRGPQSLTMGTLSIWLSPFTRRDPNLGISTPYKSSSRRCASEVPDGVDVNFPSFSKAMWMLIVQPLNMPKQTFISLEYDGGERQRGSVGWYEDIKYLSGWPGWFELNMMRKGHWWIVTLWYGNNSLLYPLISEMFPAQKGKGLDKAIV